jgi:hypothetical protein
MLFPVPKLPVTRLTRSWPFRDDILIAGAMINRARTRILLTTIVVSVLFASAVVYSNYTRRNGIIGVTEDTPAFNVRVLLTAVVEYKVRYNSLPPSLPLLGPPSAGKQVNGDAANLIDPCLALRNKNGYVFHYQPNASSDSFTITADPSGDRSPFHYFSDQTGVVRVESGRAATVASQPYLRD